jgi:hypothetical protein
MTSGNAAASWNTKRCPPPEADADQRERVFSHVVGEGEGVGRVIGHGDRPGWDVGAVEGGGGRQLGTSPASVMRCSTLVWPW